MKHNYNLTQLHPDKCFERHIFHRDQIAHVLRWFYVAKLARSDIKKKATVLDFGCGNANLLKLLYHNRLAPNEYVGIDMRQQTITKLRNEFENLPFARFECMDLCKPIRVVSEPYDFITCFEVVEHIGHANIEIFLENIKDFSNENTTILLSTPNYDEKIGAAENHLLGPDKEIGEWKHEELQAELEKFFIIEKKIGTFASVRDYKEWVLNSPYKDYYLKASEFLDNEMLSISMAPVIPAEKARNCLWVLKVRP